MGAHGPGDAAAAANELPVDPIGLLPVDPLLGSVMKKKKRESNVDRNFLLGPDAKCIERRIFHIWAWLIRGKSRVPDANVFFFYLFCLLH